MLHSPLKKRDFGALEGALEGALVGALVGLLEPASTVLLPLYFVTKEKRRFCKVPKLRKRE